MTDFVVDVALQKAETILQQQELITLTSEEWERFHALLLHPPKPNERFQQAAAEHKRIVRR